MSTYANSEYFDRPHWQVIAGGYDTERWFGHSHAQGLVNGGIANPQPTRLPSGQFYYRFASSTSPRHTQLGGGWWLDYDNFARIERFSVDHGYTLSDAARLMLALPYAWTRVDIQVRALLRRPLRAYTGAGKPAKGPVQGPDRGTRWIPTQHVAIQQLYVPGMYLPSQDVPLYESVFVQPMEVVSLVSA